MVTRSSTLGTEFALTLMWTQACYSRSHRAVITWMSSCISHSIGSPVACWAVAMSKLCSCQSMWRTQIAQIIQIIQTIQTIQTPNKGGTFGFVCWFSSLCCSWSPSWRIVVADRHLSPKGPDRNGRDHKCRVSLKCAHVISDLGGRHIRAAKKLPSKDYETYCDHVTSVMSYFS